MAKQSKNLSLDVEAVRRGERFNELYQTTLSQLVSNFLASLAIDSDEQGAPLSPAVRRLLGIGSGGTDVEDYRRHLDAKCAR